ncbi:MAG: geranylgeranyl reductase, partial [Bacteroidetes bacterium]|nr:geranylgeranyl reductase [Bacteroidota bacterium]
KVNLNNTLHSIIKELPVVAERFLEAELVGDVVGFGLPLGSKKRSISGERYMLTGDAASLIDPFSGEGIGNAMVSAVHAAEHADRCLQANNFSAEFMKKYDAIVYDDIWKGLKNSYFFQRLLNRNKWLVDALITLASKNKFVRNVLHNSL